MPDRAPSKLLILAVDRDDDIYAARLAIDTVPQKNHARVLAYAQRV